MTWFDFNSYVEEIVNFYKNKGIKKIVGIARGGLPLAVTLSHKLEVPMETLVWQTRDGKNYDTDKLLKLMNMDMKSTLFVDDICDSGVTIEMIKKHIPESRWCVLIAKRWNLVEFAPIQASDDRWITFPWEK